MMDEIAEVAVDPQLALIYEHGWQSWSPTGSYPLTERPPRPPSDDRQLMCYRPDSLATDGAFRGEGLLAVDPGTGAEVQVFAAPAADGPMPSIEAAGYGDRVVVRADGEVRRFAGPATGGMYEALARWADTFAATADVGPLRPAPTMWCSWYCYLDTVREADVDENLRAVDDLGLDVDVIQIDDGYQAEIGDWLMPSTRFTSLPDLVARIRDRGRRAGIWVAPFLVSPRSELARRHPEWLVGDASGGFNWGHKQYVLDVTRPDAAEYLRAVFDTFVAIGIDLFKLDFLYAGAVEGQRADSSLTGLQAYRRGLQMIRDAVGPQAYLLGCGAPILPSVGMVDAMRIGPDIARHVTAADGDLSQPSQHGAAVNARSRAWQHGRFWVNDADCLLATPDMEQREEWAQTVERFSGLRASSDRLRELDDWGLRTTRRLITRVPARPFDSDGSRT